MNSYMFYFFSIIACIGTSFIVFIYPSINLILRNSEYSLGSFEPAFYIYILAVVLTILGFFLCYMARYVVIRVFIIAYLFLGPLWMIYKEINNRLAISDLMALISIGLFFLIIISSLGIGVILKNCEIDKLIRWFGIFSVFIIISSIFVLSINYRGNKRDISSPSNEKIKIINNKNKSPQKLPNIYHIILDEFQTEMFQISITGDVRSSLSGFTFFPNASTPFGRTEMAMGALFSGVEYDYKIKPADYINNAFNGKQSLLYALKKLGYTLTGYLYKKYSEGNNSPFDVTIYYKEQKSIGQLPDRHWLFVSLWSFSMLPKILSKTIIPNHYYEQLASNALLPNQAPVISMQSFKQFIKSESSETKNNRYVFIHLILPHFPYVLQSDGTYIDGKLTGPIEQSKCALKLISEFIDMLKENDSFDKSLILIHGDHGARFKIRDAELVSVGNKDFFSFQWSSARSRPLILVKPAGVKALKKMSDSKARATIYDIAPTIFDSIGIAPSISLDGISLLSRYFPDRPARYYHFYDKDRDKIIKGDLHRYKIDHDGLISNMETIKVNTE